VSESANSTQRARPQDQGLIARLLMLPFQLFGVLCGSLLLSIAVECIGLNLFWPDQGWHHAQGMLDFELTQLSTYFTKSALVEEPGRTSQRLIEHTYDVLFVNSGVLEWARRTSAQAHADTGHARNIQYFRNQVYIHLETYAFAVAYTMLTFLVRLIVLCLMAPLFLTAAFAGFVDGLVRRDIRRFGAGRESGFLYHRAKASILPFVALPWVVYLALPVSVAPLFILLPSALLLFLAVNIASGSFKKYL
jgi:integrating conjugative element membrane protein (TIGR03747 family)